MHVPQSQGSLEFSGNLWPSDHHGALAQRAHGWDQRNGEEVAVEEIRVADRDRRRVVCRPGPAEQQKLPCAEIDPGYSRSGRHSPPGWRRRGREPWKACRAGVHSPLSRSPQAKSRPDDLNSDGTGGSDGSSWANEGTVAGVCYKRHPAENKRHKSRVCRVQEQTEGANGEPRAQFSKSNGPNEPFAGSISKRKKRL